MPLETAVVKSQEVVHVSMSQNRSGHRLWGPAPNVVVDREMLKEYLSEYHHQKPDGKCKADGQNWPCKVYSHLYERAYGQESWNE